VVQQEEAQQKRLSEHSNESAGQRLAKEKTPSMERNPWK
jgi:hypothetical protein